MHTQQPPSPAPILLFDPTYYGTLAATRALGQRGIPITIGGTELLAHSRWSEYVTRFVRAPVLHEPAAFLEWLLRFGQQNPGYVLYPTSDEFAWFLSFYREQLSAYYQMYSPSAESISAIIDKQSLYTHCAELSIATPETFFPKSETEIRELIPRLPEHVIIKPRTQIFLQTYNKGNILSKQEGVLEHYARFRRENRYAASIMALYPTIDWPMLQRFYPEAASSIYNLSGFIDESGEVCAVRASCKILQRPRRIGVGVCFEKDEVRPDLWEQVQALCRRIGYYGVFEVEFIQTQQDAQFLLTDFNPRFYSQLAFDVARGLPLAELAYFGAIGNVDSLQTLIEASKEEQPTSKEAYCHTLPFLIMLNGQSLSGKLLPTEVRRWRQWYAKHKHTMVDAAKDPVDRMPAHIDVLNFIAHALRHPRSFFRKMILDW